MLGFLSTIASVVLPVAKIAAQALLSWLSPEANARADMQPVPPVSRTLLTFTADEQDGTVLACNQTDRNLCVSFQNNKIINKHVALESESFEVKAASSADVTLDVIHGSNSGVCSVNYSNPAPEGESGVGARLATIAVPILSAMTFVAFSGKVQFERSVVDRDGKQHDRWIISSKSKLKSVAFDYKTQNGQTVSFKADLKEDTNAAVGKDRPYHYHVDTDDVGLAMGLLTDFNVAVVTDPESFQALMSYRETRPVSDLPAHVRARLGVA